MNFDNNLLSRIEFIEFKQKILLLKNPSHKVSIFAELELYDFLSIKDYVKNFEFRLENEYKLDFKDFELGLYKLFPNLKRYPDSAVLICKILMNLSNYNKLFNSNN